jgi:hypothetical protein
MVVVVLAVAAFAFTESYTHIFYLAQSHHETGSALRMLPLSVDLVMVGAGLVMLHLKRKDVRHPLPRAALWGGAGVTLLANVAFGITWGWEAALISAWAPIALFVAVELGMLLVRTAKAKPEEAKEAKADWQPFPFVHGSDEAAAQTELRQPQPAPSSEVETSTFPKVGGDLEGWGQLGRPDTAGLPGIGLSNGRK